MSQKSPNSAASAAKTILSAAVGSLFNPAQVTQILLQSFGQLVVVGRELLAPSGPPSGIAFRLPFDGAWKVENGGVTPATSHSWNIVTQRYAYDFTVDSEGSTHRANGRALGDYLAFGQPILAPGDGTVIKVRDGLRDAPWPGSGWLDLFALNILGNHIIIQHGRRTYSVLAHLRRNSIRVRPGQSVSSGEIIGECGNSGHSTEPHLHFHVQDRSSFYLGNGLPAIFRDVLVTAGESNQPHPEASHVAAKGERIAPMDGGGSNEIVAPSAPAPMQTRDMLFTLAMVAGNCVALAMVWYFVLDFLAGWIP